MNDQREYTAWPWILVAMLLLVLGTTSADRIVMRSPLCHAAHQS